MFTLPHSIFDPFFFDAFECAGSQPAAQRHVPAAEHTGAHV